MRFYNFKYYLGYRSSPKITELNDLRKIICLRKSEDCLKNSFNVIENLVEHGIHYLPCSYTIDVINISS